MGKRGPQPVEVAILKTRAIKWARILLAARGDIVGRAAPILRENPADIPNRASTIPVNTSDKELRKYLRAYGRSGWILFPPVPPNRRLWEWLTEPTNSKKERSLIREFNRWMEVVNARRSLQKGGPAWHLMLGGISIPNISREDSEVLRVHAKEILSARKLWAYPRRKTKRSDDLRIEFFSKVLASIELGISPATTIHKLLRWNGLHEIVMAAVHRFKPY